MADQENRLNRLGDLARRIGESGRAAYETFNARMFSPGKPLTPNTGTQEQTGGPRETIYPPASNIFVRPRGEKEEYTPFDQLRNFARLYGVAALCIGTSLEELASLKWSISAKNKADQAKFNEIGAIDLVTKFFKKPDRLNNFSTWIKRSGRDLLEIDALAIYIRRSHNGAIYALEQIDGTTIKPLIDDRGRNLAFQQAIYGLPGSDYIRYGVDSPDEILPIIYPGYEGEEWPQEIAYLQRNPRIDSPYGISPVEKVILYINMALRKQSFDIAYFEDGNIPDMVVTPDSWPEGGANLTPEQVTEFEAYFNSMLEGNDAQRRKARFISWPASFKELKEFSYETVLDEFMMKLTCAAFGVTPAELGFTDDVNRASSEGQENVQFRKGLVPLANFFKEFFDEVIEREFGLSGLEFVWDFGEVDNSLIQAQVDQIYQGMNVLTSDEIRTLRFSGQVDGPIQKPALPAPDPAPNQPAGSQPNKPALPQPEKIRKFDFSIEPDKSGYMVAFAIPAEIALKLALPEGQKDLHLTLALLPYQEQLGLEALDRVIQLFCLTEAQPVTARISGLGVFNNPGERCIYASVDSPELIDFRSRLVRLLEGFGFEVKKNHAFNPHITLKYIEETDPAIFGSLPDFTITFDQIGLWSGDKHKFYEFAKVLSAVA